MHPMTWWLASIAGAIAVVRSDSALVATLLVIVSAVLVKQLAQDAPWANGFSFALKFGVWILFIRLIAGVLIGTPDFGRTLFTLPQVHLPNWLAGIRIGGAVSQDRLLSSLHEGILIVSILALFGAATSLTSPHRLLRVAPMFIYEISIAIVIAAALLPQLVISFHRIRRAQLMRSNSRPKIIATVIPLLEESLARSLDLAAAMDSRGFGHSPVRSKYKKIRWSAGDLAVISLALTAAIALPMMGAWWVHD